jgi:thiamine biosynthesis protein ThiS
MKVVINGKEQEVAAKLTLTGLLKSLNVASKAVAVELNRQVVARERYSDICLADNDQIEIVQFVGGG